MKAPVPVKSKPNTTRQPSVAVCLRQQLIEPLFLEAVAVSTKSGALPLHRIEIDPLSEGKTKLWLDAPLFGEVLVDLLHDAVRHSNGRHKISFSVSSKGMTHCRIGITYVPKDAEHVTPENRFDIPCDCTSRTREIISQHRAALGMERENMKVTIALRLPN